VTLSVSRADCFTRLVATGNGAPARVQTSVIQTRNFTHWTHTHVLSWVACTGATYKSTVRNKYLSETSHTLAHDAGYIVTLLTHHWNVLQTCSLKELCFNPWNEVLSLDTEVSTNLDKICSAVNGWRTFRAAMYLPAGLMSLHWPRSVRTAITKLGSVNSMMGSSRLRAF
jgi:hypothetical protein